MDWSVFGAVFSAGILLVIVQGECSNYDGYFTRSQMLWEHQLEKGNSFLQHGGMWSDVFVITPLVAYITGLNHLPYRSPWSLTFLGVDLAFWWIASRYFKSLPLPEAHNHDGRITVAGWIHLGFAVIAMWILALFYFSHPPMRELVVVSIILTPFFFLGIWKIDKDWRWNPVAVWVTIGGPVLVWSVVVWRRLHS